MEEKEAAYKLGNRYISIQETEGGYDYSIFDESFRLLDGGVYDDEDMTIRDVLDAITDELKQPVYDRERDTYTHSPLQGNIRPTDIPLEYDYERLMERTEAVGQAEIIQIQSKQAVVSDFRARTEIQYRPDHLGGRSIASLEEKAREMVQEMIDTYGLDAHIEEVILSGSRCRGLEREGSDIDVVVAYSGSEREDDLFGLLHEEMAVIDGALLDINPINTEQTGTLAEYLPRVENYLARKVIELDMEYREPALRLLDKYGYELVAEQGRGQDLTLVRAPGDNECYGFDGWEMIRDYFIDVDKLVRNHDIETLQRRLEGDKSLIPFWVLDEQLCAAIRYKEEHAIVRYPVNRDKETGQERQPKQTVTFTVAECGEFHSHGALHEGIPTLQDAVKLYEKISRESKQNSIPSIGIKIHTQGTSKRDDMQCDVFYGGRIDLEGIKYIPEMSQNKEVAEVLHQFADAYPDALVMGMFPDEQTKENITSAELAAQIDDFARDHDTYGYEDNIPNREANRKLIQTDLETGNTGYMKETLKSIVKYQEGLPEDVDRAKELLRKIEDYKPLAKVEELTEQNYNMIDNVINNTPPKKEGVKEQEKPKKSRIEGHRDYGGRVSMKELLAEKMAIIAERESRAQEAEKVKKTEPCLSGDQ